MTKKKTVKVYSADNIASCFIYLASQVLVGDEKGEKEGITNLKLQKILYFAQAYFLSKLSRPLFKDRIEAWTYGPVIPSVYKKYKKYEGNPIFSDEDMSSVNEEDKEVLKNIWNTFGNYSAGRLVEITHAHAPWKEAFSSAKKTITNKLLAEYYSSLLN